jgi:hypothetical protein
VGFGGIGLYGLMQGVRGVCVCTCVCGWVWVCVCVCVCVCAMKAPPPAHPHTPTHTQSSFPPTTPPTHLLHRVLQVLRDPRRGEGAKRVARHGKVRHAVALRDDLHRFDHVPQALRLEVEAHGDVRDFHL